MGPHTLVRALLKITEPTSSLQSELSRSLLGSVIFMAVLMYGGPYSPIYNHKCENNRLAIYGEKRKRVMTNRLAT